MKNPISEIFSTAKDDNRGALIGFLTAGDPSPKHTAKLTNALIAGGVDILELGLPFSDPIADGPVIQAATIRSLEEGTTPEITLKIAHQIKTENEGRVPVVILTYFNPVFRFGAGRFLTRASKSGVNGLVVPDLPSIDTDEFREFKIASRKNDISNILLATPTTPDDRLDSIFKETSGFLYLVSLLGVTGERKNLEESSFAFVHRTRERADEKGHSAPISVGFGISSPVHVENMIKAGADGVIVGSAFVNIVRNNLDDIDRASRLLTKFAKKLKAATLTRAK